MNVINHNCRENIKFYNMQKIYWMYKIYMNNSIKHKLMIENLIYTNMKFAALLFISRMIY